MTRSALLGSTGFVGSTLAKQFAFDEHYSSSNITELGGHYDLVFCAAAPGKKWLANKDPQHDRSSIKSLIGALKSVKADIFVLISTVDVFHDANGVDETVPPVLSGLNPYGLHRFELEEAVKDHFSSAHIIRLPGLVGPGLRKNAIFDLHHRNNLEAIDSRSVFQFYPIVNLWWDVQVAIDEQLDLVHLGATPTSIQEIAFHGFGSPFDNKVSKGFPKYDFRSIHSDLFGSRSGYQYSKHDVFQAVRHFHQSEPKTPGMKQP